MTNKIVFSYIFKICISKVLKNVYLISSIENTQGDGTIVRENPISNFRFYVGYNDPTPRQEILGKYTSGADVSKQGQDLMPLASSVFTEDNTNINILTTAYMCDIEVWDKYTDSEGKAVWAMGGPTIELYANSYNATQENMKKIYYVSNDMGYYMQGQILDNTIEPDEMYGDSFGCFYLLASPTDSGEHMFISYANANIHVLAQDSGINPIVCIPISNFDYTLE